MKINILVFFWKSLIILGLIWYTITIVIVGIKGFKNIKEMLGDVKDEKN